MVALGLQPIFHSNGDAAIQQVINATKLYYKTVNLTHQNIATPFNFTNLNDLRPVCVHSQTVTYDQLSQFSHLKIIPSFFGLNLFYWGDWHQTTTIGPERAARLNPAQSALQRGLMFTQHTDAPVVLPNPIRVLDIVVNRATKKGTVIGFNESIDAYTGLLSMTRWAAYQSFE
jgi:predicted amidohydrolase YtcJ